jgi:2-dehydropantoate 2-reductase
MTNKIERVSMIGLGAIGSAYMSQIVKFFPIENFNVIAGGIRAEKYKANGINVNDKNYRFKVIDPSEKCEPAHLLIFSVKFNQLYEAIEQAKNHVGSDTIIISLLNGITSEDIIGRAYGIEKVLFSVSLAIDAVRVGYSTIFKNLGIISFGEKTNIPGHYTPKVLRLKEFFERTRINYTIPEDMMRMLWYKFMINVGVNQVSAVLRAPYGAFQNVKEARDIMIASMKEVVNISKMAKINLNDSDIDEAVKMLYKLSPVGKTSMLQDMEAGRQTEVNIFSGTVIELSKRYKVQTPVNKMLYDIIKASEGIFMYNNSLKNEAVYK